MGIFKTFVKQAQNEFESSVVKVRSDNGTEFRNTQVEEFCNDIGIKHEFSSTYTPQQNGVVERKNRTLITLAKAILDDYGISQRFWAEATACHAFNRVYLHRFLGKTPYELLIGRCNEHGTIYVISSDFGDRMTTQHPESSSVRSTGRTDARGTGASDACRKNRRYDVWCRRKSKPS